ncbi:dTMP kinase [Candidatus Nanohaloarchaea archaeon]|nr:dTMP kinase [Candidatus Nanohaloarchaea archaeon]
MRSEDFPGTFIVVEGADGAGTTTQSKKLAEELDAFWTHEPAANSVGEKVDEMISSDEYSPEAIALGFAADRMVHLEEEVIPRLMEGQTVVCDRYYHSSLVYQPVLGAEFGWVKELNSEALRPDLTVVLDVSAEIGMERVDDRGRDGNIFEELDFQEKVVVRYRELVDELDESIFLVDASQSKETVFSDLMDKVSEP